MRPIYIEASQTHSVGRQPEVVALVVERQLYQNRHDASHQSSQRMTMVCPSVIPSNSYTRSLDHVVEPSSNRITSGLYEVHDVQNILVVP